ncbi:hypothetical protein BH11PLA2_BH11PLA2_50370 [soil metagenome]
MQLRRSTGTPATAAGIQQVSNDAQQHVATPMPDPQSTPMPASPMGQMVSPGLAKAAQTPGQMAHRSAPYGTPGRSTARGLLTGRNAPDPLQRIKQAAGLLPDPAIQQATGGLPPPPVGGPPDAQQAAQMNGQAVGAPPMVAGQQPGQP